MSKNENKLLIQNFALNSELDSAGEALYQGLRRLYNIGIKDEEDIKNGYMNAEAPDGIYKTDVFYALYQTAIGFERLIKVAHKLLKLKQEKFHGNGFGHNILELHKNLSRVESDDTKEAFLKLLTDFLDTSSRYYNLDDNKKGAKSPKDLLVEYLNGDSNKLHNDGVTIASIIENYYKLIYDLSHELNIFIYEVRCDSGAGKILYGAQNYDNIFDVFRHEDRAFNEYVISLISLYKRKDDLSDFGKSLLDADVVNEYLYTEYDFLETIKNLRQGILPTEITDGVNEVYSDMSSEEVKNREWTLEIFNSHPIEGLFRDDYFED